MMAARLLALMAALVVLCALTAPARPARADVEQARATGGIIALYLRDSDAAALAIPGGAPPQELHLTLVTFGPDVRSLPDTQLRRRLADLAARHPEPVVAQVFGHAVFNPNNVQLDPATVYMIGDSEDLATVRNQVLALSEELFQLPTQHEPWSAHVTADYGLSEAELKYTGPVTFDRIGLSWAGTMTFWPL
jgi:2'-5' RNA ligase